MEKWQCCKIKAGEVERLCLSESFRKCQGYFCKSSEVNENFQLSRQYWAHLAQMLCSWFSRLGVARHVAKNQAEAHLTSDSAWGSGKIGKCLVLALYLIPNMIQYVPTSRGSLAVHQLVCILWHMVVKEMLGELRQVHQHHASHDLCAWGGADRMAQEAWLGASIRPKSPGLTSIFIHFPLGKHWETRKWGKNHPGSNTASPVLLRFQGLEGSSALPRIPGSRRCFWSAGCGFCKELKYIYGDYVTTELLRNS